MALICTGPLAHRWKAMCYSKETPNLLRDLLNIPLLLESAECSLSLSALFMGVLLNSLQACTHFAVGL